MSGRKHGVVCYSTAAAESLRRACPEYHTLVPSGARGARCKSVFVPAIPPEQRNDTLARWLIEVVATTLPPGIAITYAREEDRLWLRDTLERMRA